MVKIVEKTGATINSTRKFVWDGQEKLEFRDATDAVTQRNYPQGQYVGTTAYFYTRDHLDSIREMFTGGGTVVARYDYDPYGRSTTVLGTTPTDFNFTGLYRHSKSNVDLAVYRAYDPDLGRWLSRDPIAERGGLNLYGYTRNRPIRYRDPSGQIAIADDLVILGGAAIFFGGYVLWDYYRHHPLPVPDWDLSWDSRGKSDPVSVPDADVGRDPCGKCRPCPQPPPPWRAPGDAHGSTGGEHWHWIEYHQDPQTCKCYAKRMSGGSPP